LQGRGFIVAAERLGVEAGERALPLADVSAQMDVGERRGFHRPAARRIDCKGF